MRRGTNSAPEGLTRHVFEALRFWSANDSIKYLAEGAIVIAWRGREYNVTITRRD